MNTKTVGLALQLLEREGLLVSQGLGHRRKIVQPDGVSPALKIKILLYNQIDYALLNNRDLIHRLALAGHTATVAEKSITSELSGSLIPLHSVQAARAPPWFHVHYRSHGFVSQR